MSTRLKLNLLSLGAIAVMGLSWFCNIGWLRLILTFLLFPLISSVIFFLGNCLAAKFIHTNEPLKKVTLLSYITFLLPHLLVGDGGDIGAMYMFFGLVRNDIVVGITTSLGLCVFAFHIFILISQFALIYKHRTAKKIPNI